LVSRVAMGQIYQLLAQVLVLACTSSALPWLCSLQGPPMYLPLASGAATVS